MDDRPEAARGPEGGGIVKHDPATCEECRRYLGRPSDDGDATGGGPYTPGSAIEETGGEEGS